MNNLGTLDENQDAEIDKLFEIEVIEVSQILGVLIDRAENNRTAFRRMETKRPNFRAYFPVETNWGD